LRAANRAQQDCICRARLIQRNFRQRMSLCIVGRAADQALFKLHRQAISLQPVQHLHRLRNNLRADTVAGENKNFFHSHLSWN
jgi:hypothetical protein